MPREKKSGFFRVFQSNNTTNTTWFYRFTWRGIGYRGGTYQTAKEASDAYKEKFLEVVKESFEND